MLGREPHDFIKIRTLEAAREEWVKCRISIAQTGLAGSFDADLWVTDFDRLQTDLSRVYRELSGWMEFRTIEERIGFTVQGDGRGHFLLRGQATFDPQLGPWVRFEISFDQTEIPPILAELKALRESL